jgi:hypothetical protein
MQSLEVAMSKLCPSAQPGMENCRVLGLVDLGLVDSEARSDADKPAPRIVYLNEILPATTDVLALSAPLKPTEVFRLSATCEEHKCPHFDGVDCRLATRIVQTLPAVVDKLPPCTIRKDCRWFSQEGAAACHRCPVITTVSYDLSPAALEVCGLPVMHDH